MSFLGASRRVAALVHGLVFAIVWYFLHRPIAQMLYSFEGLEKEEINLAKVIIYLHCKM